jgi:hypothetical protein
MERVRSIAAAPVPEAYTSVGKTGKRVPRQPAYKQAVLILQHGEELPVVIRNLNHTGCRVEYFKNVKPDGRLRLREQSLALEAWANVVWKGEGACGLEFEDSEQLLERIPALWPAAPAVVTVDPPPVRARRKTRSAIRKLP